MSFENIYEYPIQPNIKGDKNIRRFFIAIITDVIMLKLAIL